MSNRKRDVVAHLMRHHSAFCALHLLNLEKELRDYMEPSDRELFVDYAWKFIGTFYIWGGDDPSGFDCSGLVVECLKAVGQLPRSGDWTAEAIWQRFANQRVAEPSKGCLVLWKNAEGRAIHVEICINKQLSLGASGGGSRTLTVQDAIDQNAFIKIRPMASRSGILGFIDPFREV